MGPSCLPSVGVTTWLHVVSPHSASFLLWWLELQLRRLADGFPRGESRVMAAAALCLKLPEFGNPKP